MSSFDQELQSRLSSIREAGLKRTLRDVTSPQGPSITLEGRVSLNFSSNDYLGLANHQALKDAAARAIRDFGAGTGASRLISGSLAPIQLLEEQLAAFKGTQAALTFSTGYATALGTLQALLSKSDIVILDKLVHASLVDAARLSRATLRVFAHNDLDDLEKKLKWARTRLGTTDSKAHILVVTESLFSMDGDHAPLAEIVELKERHGAWLMVDEAHATGLYGPHRRGLAEAQGVSDQIEIQMGTLGKAVGASGGYICGSRPLVDFLLNRARSFIFSTAPVPAAAAAALAGLQLIQSPEGDALNQTLWTRVQQFNSGYPPAHAGHAAVKSAIVPIIIGSESNAVAVANRLLDLGMFVPAIRYPTVARGSARLRVTLSAAHTEQHVKTLTTALRQMNDGGSQTPE